jgi:hypothetical protein
MDLSQAMVEIESLTGGDSVVVLNSQDVGTMMTSTNSCNFQHHVVRNDLNAATESDDEEFVDANDSFLNKNDAPPIYSSLEHLPILADQYREGSNFGTLERCGRWLMAIPRNDVLALQKTVEYRRFLEAFDKLGEVRTYCASRFVVLL